MDKFKTIKKLFVALSIEQFSKNNSCRTDIKANYSKLTRLGIGPLTKLDTGKYVNRIKLYFSLILVKGTKILHIAIVAKKSCNKEFIL